MALAGSDAEVTRDPSVDQGNGLAGTKEIIPQNGGDLMLWTGVAMFRVSDGVYNGAYTANDRPSGIPC
jgi:hypothetical protein